MSAQLIASVNNFQSSAMRLPRSLSPLETWGFGFSGQLTWLGTAPILHTMLGPNAIFIWLPGVIVSILLNLQVKRLGEHWPDMAGGTANYTTRLLRNYPAIGRYAAIGYILGWVSTPAINAIILTNLIKANLEPKGIDCPETLLKIGFTCIAYIVAFSGTRALGILHLFFVIPAIGFLLTFCLQGISWLTFSSNSPGLLPPTWPTLSLLDWFKWYFVATYAVYGCETAASFVADSKRPAATLQFLLFSAFIIPPLYVGGSWVMMRLANSPGLGEDTYKNLVAAATPFWGETASLVVTFLIASGCLLSCATTVANCPRILYQLAVDGHISPVFAVVSRRGVLVPALAFCLLISIACLVWGDIARIVIVTGTGFLISFTIAHLGFWVGRDRPEVLWPRLSLGFFVIEVIVLVVGGLAWGWQDWLLGLMLPIAILGADALIDRIGIGPFHPGWWRDRYRARRQNQIADFVAFQVAILILLICSAVTVGWFLSIRLNTISNADSNLLLVLLLSTAYIGVAIACWTSLPQVISMNEAREAAEQLFNIALDAIVVLNENGVIYQANPASEDLFRVNSKQLIGCRLNQLLPGLANQPEQWPNRSEQILNLSNQNPRILEVAISDRFSQTASQTNQDLQEYVVILRDITDRKLAEEALQKANEELEIKVKERTTELRETVDLLQQEIVERQRVEENLIAVQDQIIVQEKLASLGSLTAGIAHEIRNPLNFVNNFSELSAELTEELFEEIANLKDQLEPNTSEYISEILNDLKQNLTKINHHGQRANNIVSNMLLHSRGERGQRQETDINSLLAEYVNLAYHGMRAKDGSFNIAIEAEYDDAITQVEVIQQDIGRVFLNIVNNACYSTYQKKQGLGTEFAPLLIVKTKNLGDAIEIRIRDNGQGITPDVVEKIFNPFFTTKPPGEGTGLGLSISHDIIVQQHRGELKLETQLGSYAEFIIILPKKLTESKGMPK